MKKTHRVLCLLLVLCLASVALFAACEEEMEQAGVSSVQSGGNNTSESQFPLEKKDFGGVQIKFLTNENSDYYKWEIAPQEMVEGDRINNACRNRKELIQQEYGIELVQEYVKTQDDVIDTLRESVESGLDEYQVGVSGLLYLAKLTDAELFLDLSHIESNNYLDLTKPYWDQSIMRDLTTNRRGLSSSTRTSPRTSTSRRVAGSNPCTNWCGTAIGTLIRSMKSSRVRPSTTATSAWRGARTPRTSGA